MFRYLLRRVIAMIPVLFIVSIIVFLIVHLTPGNPAYLILGEDSSPEAIAEIEEQLGLNQSIFIQFFDWMINILRGDFGQSVYSSQPVLDVILERIGPTFSLTFMSMGLTLIIAIPLAIFVIWLRNTFVGPLFTSSSLLGTSIPEFWFAMLLVLAFGVSIPLFPVAGYIPVAESFTGWIYHLILPAIVLATVEVGLISRMLRDSMLESVNQDYIKTARGKGLKESIVLTKHVFVNALIPTTTVVGVMIASLLGGTIIIETIFTIPGVGQLLVDSIHRRDYPMIQGVVLFIAVVYVFINLLIDILYTFLDPRISYD